MSAGRHFYLTPVLGGPGAPRYALSAAPQLIGRADSADIPLLEPTVSRQHASVQLSDGQVLLEDLGSKHGTFVNSKRVTSAKLQPGDIVVFGLTLVLRVEESAAPVDTNKAAGDIEGTPTLAGVPAVGPLGAIPTAVTHIGQGDVSSLQDKLASARKLAGGGALCALLLPDLVQRLKKVNGTLEGQQAVNSAALRGALHPILSQLDEIVTALAITPPQLESVSVAELVNEAQLVVTADASARRIVLKAEFEGEVRAKAHPERLTAAVIELLRNAIEASESGQRITISGRVAGETVVLLIRDFGRGLPSELAQRAFDPFVTLPSDGAHLGLGLLLARQLLMSFGASMVIQSSPNMGSTLRIKLSAA